MVGVPGAVAVLLLCCCCPAPTCVPRVLLDPQELQAQVPLVHAARIQRHRRRHGQHQLRGMTGGRPVGCERRGAERRGGAGRATEGRPTWRGLIATRSTVPRCGHCSSATSQSLPLWGRTKLPPRSVCSKRTCFARRTHRGAVRLGGRHKGVGRRRLPLRSVPAAYRHSGKPRLAAYAPKSPPTAIAQMPFAPWR